ncbi:MAG: transglycosylase domain-containing protein [Bacteroidales bacterium]|jgi:penicillin-binding protein 1A|nr:transglycosylase domain-containing protein [Bacteroidales bacterium]
MGNIRKKSKQKSNNKALTWLWRIFIGGFATVILIFFLISVGALGFMPSFEDLENPKTNLATEIISEDGYVLGKYYVENRSPAQYYQLPDNLINALVATEDARFYKHSGVDVRAIMRALFGVLTFSNRGGGSTITQQLAKNLFPRGEDRNMFEIVFIKLKEWVVAVKLERNYSKNEILAMYLNTVDFGNLSHGINSAAKTYFDKSPKDLTAEESALLIGMLKAPSKFNPKRHPEDAKKRRNVVLSQMEKYGYLTENECNQYKETEIDMSHFKLQDHRVGSATYLREYLRLKLQKWAEENPKPDGSHWNIYKDGLKIYTTINYKMQQYAEDAVKEWVAGTLQEQFFKEWKGKKNAPFYNLSDEETQKNLTKAMKETDRYKELKKNGWSDEKIRANFETPVQMWLFNGKDEIDTVMSPFDSIRHMKSFLNCGFLAIESKTGKVRAYVGGVNFEYFKYDHVTTSRRQVGSTFKPFVYTVAMQDAEYYPCTQIPNLPVTIDLPNGQSWTPKNSSKYKEGQMVTLSEALANSMNNVSAYLMKRIGPAAVINLLRKMGVQSDIPEVPAICLGACELKLEEMVGAINTFNNQGVYIKPYYITKICTSKGQIIATFSTTQEEPIDKVSAYKTVRLMQGVVLEGTAARLNYRYKLNMPMAGKTGTTDDNADGWFMGYTPLLTAGVWVGCDDRQAHFRSTALGQGANSALPVWALFMKKCYEDPTLKLTKDEFPKPDNELLKQEYFDCQTYNSMFKTKNIEF